MESWRASRGRSPWLHRGISLLRGKSALALQIRVNEGLEQGGLKWKLEKSVEEKEEKGTSESRLRLRQDKSTLHPR